jgi:hypothetical protein
MVIYLSLFIKIGCTQSNPLQFINVPKKSTSLSRSQAYKFDPETGRHERETAHKIPWGKNSTWGRSFMTLGLVPLCCSPGHISAIFRQQTIFPSEWSMAISMRSYRSWSQLFHRSILSFSFRSLPCLPIPLRIKLQLELDVLQINNYLIPLTSIFFAMLFLFGFDWFLLCL